jgi:hypothetical protein
MYTLTYGVSRCVSLLPLLAKVLAFDRETINDPRVKLEMQLSTEPAPVASTSHPAFAALRDCVWEVFPHASVAPGLFIAASDSKVGVRCGV